MKMSTKGRYGLRIMQELAAQHGKGPVMVQLIERNQGISGKYIHVLMGDLKAAGLVRAVRGPSGGYALTRDPSAITALEVVTSLEGPIAPADCVRGLSCCPRMGACATQEVWQEVTDAIQAVLSRHSIRALAERQRSMATDESTYMI